MNPGWIVGNGIAVVSAVICMAYLTHVLRTSGSTAGRPILSIVVISVTAIITGLQFVYPEVLVALRRDGDGLRSGEIWRLVTPILIQPAGIVQCALNAALALMFIPLTERLYGRGMLALYFSAGIAGQIALYAWDSPLTGGSSTAIFGTIGGLLVYTVRHGRRLRMPFVIIAAIGILGGATLAILRDGHGVGLLTGVLLGAVLARWDMVEKRGLVVSPRI